MIVHRLALPAFRALDGEGARLYGGRWNSAGKPMIYASANPSLPVLGLARSVLFEEAERLGLRTVPEAFADRSYRPDVQLVSRRERNAVLRDPDEIADRVASMVQSGRVVAVDGSTIPITVESVCVHGDSPGAVQIATAVRDRLLSDGVELAAFT